MLVNGQKYDLRDMLGIRSLQELIQHFDIHPESIAVEMNGNIPSREKWVNIMLKEDDRIELIRFVGGG